MNVKDLLSKWGPFLLVAAIGIGVGWTIKPNHIQTEFKEKVVEKEVTTEAMKKLMASLEQLRIEINKVKESQTNEKYHQEVDENTLPDGTRTKKTVTDRNIDSHVKETEVKTEVKVVEVEKRVETIKTEFKDKIVEVEKKETQALPQWHVGVLAGISPRLLPAPAFEPLVVGAEAERRLGGPFFIGAWGLGTLDGQLRAGLKLGLEF